MERLIVSGHNLYTNAIVYSEFMFYYLATIGNKSPLSIKVSKKIKELIEVHDPIRLFSYFQVLPMNHEDATLSYTFMQKYNLLPNDALILASTKLSGIENLASFDEKDFALACEKENITLIDSLSKLD